MMFARILASLAAGWLTVVAEIGVFLRIFPKNYMDFMAVLAILFGIVSFGIFALLFWLFARRMPRRLDPQGMTLRNGRRIAWKEVVSVDEVWVTRYGMTLGRRWDIRSASVTALVIPVYIAESRAVLEFLSRVLGRKLT